MMKILKVTKTQRLTLSLEDIFFKKPQEGGAQFDTPPALFRIKTIFQNLPQLFLEASDILHGGVVLYGVFC